MNLHGLVAPLVTAINPNVPATLRVSNGTYAVQGDGTRVPSYTDVAVNAQVQAMSAEDLQQVEGLNIQGVLQKVYLYGEADGVVRPTAKGGDLIIISSGVFAGTWLINQNMEQWPDWCSCACTLQN
jgi:hypothetical protein